MRVHCITGCCVLFIQVYVCVFVTRTHTNEWHFNKLELKLMKPNIKCHAINIKYIIKSLCTVIIQWYFHLLQFFSLLSGNQKLKLFLGINIKINEHKFVIFFVFFLMRLYQFLGIWRGEKTTKILGNNTTIFVPVFPINLGKPYVSSA